MARSLHPITQTFVDALIGKGHLTQSCYSDFGLDSGRPWGGLNATVYTWYIQGWLKKLFTPHELDEAKGNGPKLTKLLKRVNPSAEVKCIYDATTANDLEEQKG